MSTKHDVSTSTGARAFLDELFQERVQRNDFGRYIRNDLAGDFATTLSRWLVPTLAKVNHYELIESAPADKREVMLYDTLQERDALQARNDALSAVLEEVLENAERGLPDPLHRKLRQLLPPPVPAPANEAERPGFEKWHRDRFKTKYTTGDPTRDMHSNGWSAVYGPPNQQQMWEAWQARAAKCGCHESRTWSDYEGIVNAPDVHEALTLFSGDSTGDAGVMVVRAVLDNLKGVQS